MSVISNLCGIRSMPKGWNFMTWLLTLSVQWNISAVHTRSSRDCGRPFGEHVTLLASCFGLENFCGVFVFGVVGAESFCGVFVSGVVGVLSATNSSALRIYINKYHTQPLTFNLRLTFQQMKLHIQSYIDIQVHIYTRRIWLSHSHTPHITDQCNLMQQTKNFWYNFKLHHVFFGHILRHISSTSHHSIAMSEPLITLQKTRNNCVCPADYVGALLVNHNQRKHYRKDRKFEKMDRYQPTAVCLLCTSDQKCSKNTMVTDSNIIC